MAKKYFTFKHMNSENKLSKEQLKEVNKELVRRNLLVGYYMTFIIFCAEIFMIAYSLFVFDFSRVRHVTYLILYCFLLVVSLFSFLYIKYLKSKPDLDIKKGKFLTYSYMFIILLWGTYVGVLDMMVGNQAIVFFSVVIGVIGVLLLPPKPLIITIFSSIGLFVVLVYITEFYVSNGFAINMFVFAVTTIILCLRRYEDFIVDFLQREELIKVNLQLQHLSKHDVLTGLFNRSAMNEDLDALLKRCIIDKLAVAVIMMDIDNFKRINDTSGHNAGDESIKAVASIIKDSATKGKVYRYGGEEFCVIIEDIEKEEAIILGKYMVNQAAKVNLPQYPEISMTISSGLYHAIPEQADNTDSYLIRADRNLYAAKNSGKNKFVY